MTTTERVPQILIVDDEEDIRDVFAMTLASLNIEAEGCATIQAAKEILQHKIFDVCFTDMKLPDGDGLALLQHVQKHFPKMPIAMITAFGNVELAVQALKYGAFDFVSKPIDIHKLRNLVQQALALRVPDFEQKTEVVFGNSILLEFLKGKILKLARSQAPVLITGESGTGKELVARMIHDLGGRSNAAFVPVNCGAIPEQLMESEFFGHLKGSFTGAVTDKEGLFKAADKGTLFLDEVADLPLAMQVKLLRAIQEKAIKPVGSTKEIEVDVRILSATHKNLKELIKQGVFRQDLFYRINVIEISLPSLRERLTELPQLIHSILTKLCAQRQITIPALTPEAVQALMNYSFPGNIRELENILERALTLAERDRITIDDLQLSDDPNKRLHDSLPVISSSPNVSSSAQATKPDLTNYLDDQERQQIMTALTQTGGNKTKAAVLLGISFRALRYRLKKLGMK